MPVVTLECLVMAGRDLDKFDAFSEKVDAVIQSAIDGAVRMLFIPETSPSPPPRLSHACMHCYKPCLAALHQRAPTWCLAALTTCGSCQTT